VDGIKVESTLPADLRAVVMQEANRQGLPVVGHSKDARESIEAGMKFIEHMWPIASSLMPGERPKETMSSPLHDELIDLDKAPELIDLMVNNGVVINPTLLSRYGYFSDVITGGAEEDAKNLGFGGVYSDIPAELKKPVLDWWERTSTMKPEMLKTYKAGFEKVKAFLKMFSEAGGRILTGTDAGQDRLTGLTLHREMQMFVNAGITPYRTLLGSTRWPAESMYKDELIGTIEQGKQADVVILGANPVDDIANTRDIRYVIRKGEVVRAPDDCSVIIPPISMSCAE
jgi:imidazolonepropionase-like amidohydrolase